MVNHVTDSIYYVGANDHDVDLFEGQYVVPNGMAYNSYVIMDDSIAVMDTIDQTKTEEWLDKIEEVLDGALPDYLVVQHMEPDHAASIEAFVNKYPSVTVVGNAKTFVMMGQFFPNMTMERTMEVKEGDALSLGSHTLNFVFAPMVHWPEVMMTYESSEKILFAADGFGKFGALDVEEDWADEARRYYIGIVGKYGKQVQNILKKAAGLDISIICPLHGPVLKENLGYYLNLYDTWSSYRPESEGVCVCYTSVYGHTKAAVELLCEKLKEAGAPKVVCHDLARCDMAKAVEDAFRYDKLVLATTTYNADIFPFMKTFIDHLVERNYQNRTIGLLENGSWAPQAIKIMKIAFANSKDITFAKNNVTIKSALNGETTEAVEALAKEMAASYCAADNVIPNDIDPTALFNIGYGLYVVTTNDGTKDNGFICNTVTQVTNTPNRIAVTVNKLNYSCETISKTGVLNVATLSQEAPFSIFETFGFQSGRDTDKFANFNHVHRSANGLLFLDKYANGYISGKVISEIDLDTHKMFICDVTECAVLSDKETMTYTYYQNHVKPKPETDKKGFVCKVCGYIYEGDELPEGYICPLCKHGVEDFEPLQ